MSNVSFSFLEYIFYKHMVFSLNTLLSGKLSDLLNDKLNCIHLNLCC